MTRPQNAGRGFLPYLGNDTPKAASLPLTSSSDPEPQKDPGPQEITGPYKDRGPHEDPGHHRSKRYFPGLLEYACAEFVFNSVFIFLKNYLPKILTTTKRKPKCKSLKLPSSNPCVIQECVTITFVISLKQKRETKHVSQFHLFKLHDFFC